MENKPQFTPEPKLKMMEQVWQALNDHHYALNTEQATLSVASPVKIRKDLFTTTVG